MLDQDLKQDEELRRINRQIKRLIRQKKIVKKKIYIFGVSIRTRKIIQVLRSYEMEPVNILDNDAAKQNSYCAGVKVIAPERIKNSADNENVYIVSSAYWREMTAQLERENIKRKNIYCIYIQRKFLTHHLLEAWQGRHIYNRLIKKYGDVSVFLCPYTGTGDIYLIGCFWRRYIEQNGIEDYIFVVVSQACKKVATIFGIKNIEVLKKQRHSSYMLYYYLLCPGEAHIVTLNDSWPCIHTNPLEWFRGYKGLNFTEMFRRYVFNLPDDARPERPMLENVESTLAPLFENNGLIPGKTVVLSPYSNTLADLPDVFWTDLAEILKKKGYTVCTNCSRISEPAVEGTASVFFPLNIAPQFVEKAGGFVGVRSGLCDVISAADAKKIILYDAGSRFYNSSAYEYFSLKHMGLCSDAIEIELENEDIKNVIEQVAVNF